MSKRLFDILMSVGLLLVCFLPIIIICLVVKLTSKGPVFFMSDRVGRHNRIFRMYKFRTMRTDTPNVATHLMDNPGRYLTSVGGFMRRSSLDELPQVLNILKGDMSFVGPRPALFNQDDLIALRTEKGVDAIVPGLTGWAQVNGRDELPIPVKVGFDEYYLKNRSFIMDMRILLITALKVVRSEGVTH